MVDKLSRERVPGTYPATLEGAHIIPHSLSEAKTELEVMQIESILRLARTKEENMASIRNFCRPRNTPGTQRRKYRFIGKYHYFGTQQSHCIWENGFVVHS
jgi:hypothetical protein